MKGEINMLSGLVRFNVRRRNKSVSYITGKILIICDKIYKGKEGIGTIKMKNQV